MTPKADKPPVVERAERVEPLCLGLLIVFFVSLYPVSTIDDAAIRLAVLLLLTAIAVPACVAVVVSEWNRWRSHRNRASVG